MIQKILEWAREGSPRRIAVLAPDRFEQRLLTHRFQLVTGSTLPVIRLRNGSHIVFGTFDDVDYIDADEYFAEFGDTRSVWPLDKPINIIEGELI